MLNLKCKIGCQNGVRDPLKTDRETRTKPPPPEPYRTELLRSELPRPEPLRPQPPQPKQSFAVGAAQLEADPTIPLPVQAKPNATAGVKQDHSEAKNGKKSRKPQLAHHCDSPWPPRNQQVRRPIISAESLNNNQPVLTVIPHGAVEYSALDNQHRHISQDPEGWVELPVNAQDGVSVDHEQHISPKIEGQVVAAQVAGPFDQGDCPSPTSRNQICSPTNLQHSVTANYDQQIIDTRKEHLSLSTDVPDAVYNTDGLNRNTHRKPHGHKDIEIISPAWPVGYAKNRPVDEPLHGISSRAGTSRVSKPQKKTRIAAALRPIAAMPAIGNRDELPQAFDHVLDSLRIIVSKTYSDHTSGINAHKGRIEALQQVIDLQKATIQALKKTDATARVAMGRQADTVEKLKNYVRGLETDHAKIKANVKSYHDECNKVWKEKVGEVTAEKAELEREFSTMIHAVSQSRQSMKQAMVECCHRLELSEHKRITLVQDLKMQHALLEAEKKKSTDLEQQILSSLQAIHGHFENSIGIMIEKLGSIQNSVEDTSADDKRDACLNECLDALKELQAIPFLTAKDAQKAEGMIRFLHET
jgi:hypothetical protein